MITVRTTHLLCDLAFFRSAQRAVWVAKPATFLRGIHCYGLCCRLNLAGLPPENYCVPHMVFDLFVILNLIKGNGGLL